MKLYTETKSSIKPISDLLSVLLLLHPNSLVLVLVHIVVDSVPHNQAQGTALLRPPLAVGGPLAFRLSGKVDIQAKFRNP